MITQMTAKIIPITGKLTKKQLVERNEYQRQQLKEHKDKIKELTPTRVIPMTTIGEKIEYNAKKFFNNKPNFDNAENIAQYRTQKARDIIEMQQRTNKRKLKIRQKNTRKNIKKIKGFTKKIIKKTKKRWNDFSL